MKKNRNFPTRAEILERDLNQVCLWESERQGLEAKAWNIQAKYGYVPAPVQAELDRAEMEYGFALALYKDNKSDPYL